MTRYNVHLPAQQLAALRKLAEERGISVAELIRRAIEEFLRREK